MLTSSPNDVHRVEVGPETDRRVYLLKTPTRHERLRLKGLLTVAGARRHGPHQRVDALADALRAAEASALRDASLLLVDAHRDLVVAHGKLLGSREKGPEHDEAVRASWAKLQDSSKALFVIEAEVIGNNPRYAQMAADDEVFWEKYGLEAARVLLVGWEGISAAIERTNGLLTEASLEAIPEDADLIPIGLKAFDLVTLSERQRKNSSSPAPTPSAGETSSTSTTIQ